MRPAARSTRRGTVRTPAATCPARQRGGCRARSGPHAWRSPELFAPHTCRRRRAPLWPRQAAASTAPPRRRAAPRHDTPAREKALGRSTPLADPGPPQPRPLPSVAVLGLLRPWSRPRRPPAAQSRRCTFRTPPAGSAGPLSRRRTCQTARRARRQSQGPRGQRRTAGRREAPTPARPPRGASRPGLPPPTGPAGGTRRCRRQWRARRRRRPWPRGRPSGHRHRHRHRHRRPCGGSTAEIRRRSRCRQRALPGQCRRARRWPRRTPARPPPETST
mmetsp:Transcript_17231/g.44902  ORF Transcript_17231/g.44902 Transcript_17231/m.44902 type:complete len:275 (-) Transcript_17231:703-1527(-)